MIKRILCACAAIIALASGAHTPNKSNIVRLHVIAQSDSEEDQAFKLRVRDAALEALEPYLRNCGDFDELYAALEAGAADVERAANALAQEEGREETIHVETGAFEYGDRECVGGALPAGEYRAMQVVIGEGAGHNWWSILYPDKADADAVYYSAIIEWLMDMLGGRL